MYLTRNLLRCLPATGRAVCYAIVLGALTANGVAANKKAAPPPAKDLVGVCIGVDADELAFTRLELQPNSTGFLARVGRTDTILHDQGVHLWRVTSWSIDGWNIVIHVSPISNAYSVRYVKGRADWLSLRLTMGGPENGGWKEQLLLYPEARIAVANGETRKKIGEAER